MSGRSAKRLGAFGVALGLAVLCFILLLTALHNVGTDDARYYRLQMDAGILPRAGISEDDLRTLDAATSLHSASALPPAFNSAAGTLEPFAALLG